MGAHDVTPNRSVLLQLKSKIKLTYDLANKTGFFLIFIKVDFTCKNAVTLNLSCQVEIEFSVFYIFFSLQSWDD